MAAQARKGYYGWSAESAIKLSDTHVLKILTMKRSSGALVTTASVDKIEGEMLAHTMYQDFHKQVVSNRPARVTQKVVEAQHNGIDLEPLIKEAKEFYKIK